MDELFGWSNGSTDEVDSNLTGREWMQLFRYNNRKFLYFLACFSNLLQSTSSYLLTIAQGKLTTILVTSDYETAEDFIESINKVSMLMIYSILTRFFVSLCTEFLEQSSLQSFYKNLKVGLFGALLEQDVTYFDKYQTGVILSRLSDDVSNAYDNYADNITLFSYYAAQVVVGTSVCLYYSWKATLIIFCCFPIYFLSELLSGKYITKLYLKYNERKTNVSAKAEEILTSFRTVKSFDSELNEYHSYRKKLFDVNEVISETSFVRASKNFVQTLTNWGFQSFILYYMGIKAIKKEIEPGAITTILYIVNLWSHTLSSIFIAYNELIKSNVSAAKLLEIFNRKSLINLHEGRIIDKIKGEIVFDNVVFKYPTRENNALDGISFKIQPGETIAIVGESGCGKSTILQLLQRFYDTTNGEILIDGINIKEINPISLRSHIAIVQQSPFIFSMSAKDNIRFGKPNAHREDVINTAEIANAHNFIIKLKDGYKTQINQNCLSGGQKQRICIARALLMNAQILLLDEATAALDTESERLVQESISNFRKGKTVIIVAHRLATVKIASRILVINNGRIIEEGTHDELIARSGKYMELVKHQLQ